MAHWSRGSRVAACLVGGAMAAGCYTYRPPPIVPPAPGTEVRAQLSTEAVLRIETELGRFRRAVEGELLEYNDSRVLLLVPVTATPGVERGPLESGGALRQRVVLEPSEILLLEQRQFDRTRTLALSGAGLVAAAYILWRAFSFESGGEPAGLPPGGPDMMRVPR